MDAVISIDTQDKSFVAKAVGKSPAEFAKSFEVDMKGRKFEEHFGNQGICWSQDDQSRGLDRGCENDEMELVASFCPIPSIPLIQSKIQNLGLLRSSIARR